MHRVGEDQPRGSLDAGVKVAVEKTEKSRGDVSRLGAVSTPVKLTGRRESRFLALLQMGVTVAEACRAVGVSRQTVYRHAHENAGFGVRLASARIIGRAPVSAVGARISDPDGLNWQMAAAQLERDFPERWALPTPWEIGEPRV